MVPNARETFLHDNKRRRKCTIIQKVMILSAGFLSSRDSGGRAGCLALGRLLVENLAPPGSLSKTPNPCMVETIVGV